MKVIKIGTRASALACKQAEIAKMNILEKFPLREIEIIKISTKGDLNLDKELDKIGGKGVFVTEIENALLDGTIDIAVHSMKDMPYEMPEGLIIGGVSKRENPMDVLISKDNETLSTIKEGARIGTGSLRRKHQLLSLRPDLEIIPIRGNIETRMEKIGFNVDAVVLAFAGIYRGGYFDRIAQVFTLEEMIPAGCQGILAYETRKDDIEIERILKEINDRDSFICQSAEQAFLSEIGAGCHAPVGVYSRLNDKTINIDGYFYSNRAIRLSLTGSVNDAVELGRLLAKRILEVVI